MESFDEKIRRILLAGVGAVSEAASRSRQAVEQFGDGERMKELAQKGEEALESARALGAEAVERLRRGFSEAEIEKAARERAARIRDLAEGVHALPEPERQAFQELLDTLDREELPEDGSLQSEEEFCFGKTEPSPAADLNGDHPPPLSPIAPDDDLNTNKIKTNDVNDHIPQSIPPDY